MDKVTGYGFEICLAILICGLLLAVWSLAHINYGHMVITKITTRPYKIALVLIFSQFVQILSYTLLLDVYG